MDSAMMTRAELFSLALSRSREALVRFPFMFPLESIIKQLEYLIEVEAGRSDGADLSTICIGEITARDIDDLDEELAALLHMVSAEVRLMSAR